MSGLSGWSLPVDATLCLKGKMECALMGHGIYRGGYCCREDGAEIEPGTN